MRKGCGVFIMPTHPGPWPRRVKHGPDRAALHPDVPTTEALTMRIHTLPTLVTAALLTACAGKPLVEVQAPGFALAQSRNPEVMSLPKARELLLQLRATYREAMAAQLEATQFSGAGLVTLGALVTGLAAGRAHPDAIIGASLLGGTAYAVGTLTLDRRRVLAFDAGIRALDCAQAAVIPLDLDAPRQQALAVARTALTKSRGDTAASAARLRAQLLLAEKAAALDDAPRQAAERALADAEAALAEADKARKAAQALADDARRVGQQLQATVQAISAKVDGVIAQTVPDLAAVQQVVGGLGGLASTFAPGAGVDQTLADALGRYQKAGEATARSGSPEQEQLRQAVADELATLAAAGSALAAAVEAVNQVIGSVDGSAVATALKACNVAEVALPLELKPAALTLQAQGGPKGFAISGGTKPYAVQWLDAAPEGLSINFVGGAFADIAQVGASDKTPPDNYRLRVADAAGHSQQLLVTVNAAGGATTPLVSTAGTAAEAAALARLAEALKQLPEQPGKGFRFKAGDVAVAGAGVTLSVTCAPLPAAADRPARADLLDKLFAGASKAAGYTGANPLRLHTVTPACAKD